mmetsp:Transcript_70659/g.165701  ORF Transcript_70659/g.165701 Transcript_70659/m.165701 type:complete len:201 (+) Transcript_70659:512-1114(+)
MDIGWPVIFTVVTPTPKISGWAVDWRQLLAMMAPRESSSSALELFMNSMPGPREKQGMYTSKSMVSPLSNVRLPALKKGWENLGSAMLPVLISILNLFVRTSVTLLTTFGSGFMALSPKSESRTFPDRVRRITRAPYPILARKSPHISSPTRPAPLNTTVFAAFKAAPQAWTSEIRSDRLIPAVGRIMGDFCPVATMSTL